MAQHIILVINDETDEVALVANVEHSEQLALFCAGLSRSDPDEAAHIQETLETEGVYGIRDDEGRALTVGLYKQCNTLEPDRYERAVAAGEDEFLADCDLID